HQRHQLRRAFREPGRRRYWRVHARLTARDRMGPEARVLAETCPSFLPPAPPGAGGFFVPETCAQCVSLLRKRFESFSTCLSFSIKSFGNVPLCTLSMAAGIDWARLAN